MEHTFSLEKITYDYWARDFTAKNPASVPVVPMLCASGVRDLFGSAPETIYVKVSTRPFKGSQELHVDFRDNSTKNCSYKLNKRWKYDYLSHCAYHTLIKVCGKKDKYWFKLTAECPNTINKDLRIKPNEV